MTIATEGTTMATVDTARYGRMLDALAAIAGNQEGFSIRLSCSRDENGAIDVIMVPTDDATMPGVDQRTFTIFAVDARDCTIVAAFGGRFYFHGSRVGVVQTRGMRWIADGHVVDVDSAFTAARLALISAWEPR